MALPTPVDQLADAVAVAGTTIGALAQARVSLSSRRRRRHRARRERAYEDLQHAVIDVVISCNELAGIRPSLNGLIWVFGPFQRALSGFSSSTHLAVKSWLDVRSYGNPEPRLQAERLMEAVRELVGVIPTGSRQARSRQRPLFDATQCVLGQVQRDYTVAVRVDLGLDRPRRHAWQIWRRRQIDWPGGWPVRVEIPAQTVARLGNAGEDGGAGTDDACS